MREDLVGEGTRAAAAAVEFRRLVGRGLDINGRSSDGEAPLFIFVPAGWMENSKNYASHSEHLVRCYRLWAYIIGTRVPFGRRLHPTPLGRESTQPLGGPFGSYRRLSIPLPLWLGDVDRIASIGRLKDTSLAIPGTHGRHKEELLHGEVGHVDLEVAPSRGLKTECGLAATMHPRLAVFAVRGPPPAVLLAKGVDVLADIGAVLVLDVEALGAIVSCDRGGCSLGAYLSVASPVALAEDVDHHGRVFENGQEGLDASGRHVHRILRHH